MKRNRVHYRSFKINVQNSKRRRLRVNYIFFVTYILRNRCILFVLDYFKDKADEWVRPKIKTYLLEIIKMDIQQFFQKWIFFKKKIGRDFDIISNNKIVEQYIQTIY